MSNVQQGTRNAEGRPFGVPCSVFVVHYSRVTRFGTIAFVNGQFQTDGQKSTIEVVNLMLGKGNDALDIQGTLDPAPPVSATGTFAS